MCMKFIKSASLIQARDYIKKSMYNKNQTRAKIIYAMYVNMNSILTTVIPQSYLIGGSDKICESWGNTLHISTYKSCLIRGKD